MNWRWYVYEITRGDRVIYVGKGTSRRAEVSAGLRGGKPVLIAYFKHEEHAYEFERERIALRILEGHRLLNISNGTTVSWWKRTDTKAYAAEVLDEIAWRIGNWIKAGKVGRLAAITGIPEGKLVSLHQVHGH